MAEQLVTDLKVIDEALNDALGPLHRALRHLESLSDVCKAMGSPNATVDRYRSDVEALVDECARVRNECGDLTPKDLES